MNHKRAARQDFIKVQDHGGAPALTLSGEWTIFTVPALHHAVEDVQPVITGQDFTVDASGIERLDTAGAEALKTLLESGRASGVLTDRQRKLLDFLPKNQDRPEKTRQASAFFRLFGGVGYYTEQFLGFVYEFMCFIGMIALRFLANFRHPRHFRIASVVRHIQETGIQAIPIVALLSFLMSMVIAYQASIQLQKFGASLFTVDLTVISLLREMGVLITAIMVAGRSGSAFAAEIGVMKLREEVDALKTIGLDPIEILVLPRLTALLISLPMLTFIADIVGMAGGAVMAITLLDVPLDMFMTRASNVGTPMMFFVGMIKAPVFAFLIAAIGTYQGMNVSGSAESVGRLTTVAVVQSIFLVILMDAVFSILFAQLKI
jgi:phospholipid/cholesterol/gamma-HCH transport system permease protein